MTSNQGKDQHYSWLLHILTQGNININAKRKRAVHISVQPMQSFIERSTKRTELIKLVVPALPLLVYGSLLFHFYNDLGLLIQASGSNILCSP